MPGPAVTWIDVDDVLVALGPAPTAANDVAWLEACVNAANVVAYRDRAANNYVDDPALVPDDAVANGVVTYAVERYRSRGAVDGYASFEEAAGFGTPSGGSFRAARKLWGCPRMGFG